MAEFYDPRPLIIQSPPFDMEEAEMADADYVYCFGCKAWVSRTMAGYCTDKYECDMYWLGMESHFVE